MLILFVFFRSLVAVNENENHVLFVNLRSKTTIVIPLINFLATKNKTACQILA
jgi:hypothetical protein